jgi:hypothetical protein
MPWRKLPLSIGGRMASDYRPKANQAQCPARRDSFIRPGLSLAKIIHAACRRSAMACQSVPPPLERLVDHLRFILRAALVESLAQLPVHPDSRGDLGKVKRR